MNPAEQTPGGDEISWDAAIQLLAELPALPAGERGEAVDILVRNSSPGVRERALRLGSRLLSDQRLLEHLHDDHDAVLRNAGLEMLKMRGATSLALAVRLLSDADADVVLQAILVLDHLRDPRALEPLRALLASPDLNLVQAAILAIGHLGDERSSRDLRPFLHGDPWLQMAAVQSLGDLRSRRALPDLRRLFADPVAGQIAIEAVARIGGRAACRVLAGHWLGRHDQGEAEPLLSLLAHALEGLSSALSQAQTPGGPELMASLAARLADASPGVRAAAARCLLALGPSAGDDPALAALTAAASTGEVDTGRLPPCLRRRPDLIAALLRQPGARRAWGFYLAALFPRRVPRAEILFALGDLAAAGVRGQVLAAAFQCIGALPPGTASPAFGKALLDLFVGLPAALRAELGPSLRRHRAAVQRELAARTEVGQADRVALAARLGAGAQAVAAELVDMPFRGRLAAIAELASHRQVMRLLPWSAWLQESPDTYTTLAAEVAAASRLAEMLPLLRALPPQLAGPASLRAFVELQDRAAVPLLVAVLRVRPDLRLPTLESLGRIGGAEARQALAETALRGGALEARQAYRAWSLCAAEEDGPLFRAAAVHTDWQVRLACAEALGRFAGADNLASLALLAGDPVAAVAQRALTALAE